MADEQDYLNSLLEAATTGRSRPKALSLFEREVEAYISIRNVREGPNNIPLDAIYSDYISWSNKPMSLVVFKRYFSRQFKKQARYKHVYYKLEADSFGLPDFYSITTDPNYKRYRPTHKHPRMIGVWKHASNAWYSKLLLPTGKYLPLGTYKTALEAAHTYDEAAILVYGKDAVLNFPKKWRTLFNGQKDIPLTFRRKKSTQWFNKSVKNAKEEQARYEKLLEALSRGAGNPSR